MNKQNFNIGDIVKFKADGPLLLLSLNKLNPNLTWTCDYFDAIEKMFKQINLYPENFTLYESKFISNEIKAGDIVVLKGIGPQLSLSFIDTKFTDNAHCVWYNKVTGNFEPIIFNKNQLVTLNN